MTLQDQKQSRRVLVTGATGYIGGRLVAALLDTGWQVRIMTRDTRHLQGRGWLDEVEVRQGDVLQPDTLSAVLDGVDTAYYLIHSMDDGDAYYERDIRAARNFAQAAEAQGLKRIIYLGGLGDGGSDDLSEHLESRQQVGKVLRSGAVPVTEFRAAVVVGAGSASFEMVRYLTERLPVMITPRWVHTRTQPIAVDDALAYLTGALTTPASSGEVIEIGGADVLSYGDMMLGYAEARGLKRYMLRVPVLTPHLSSYWIHIVTPISANIARPLVEGLRNEVVVQDDRARQLFPQIQPVGYAEAVRAALDELRAQRVETTWTDSMAASWEDDEPYVFTEERGMMIERRKRIIHASQNDVYHAFTGLGGRDGWLYLNWLWRLRGVLDRFVGGPGYRQGRREAGWLRTGDALDFWRVETVEPGKSLRLRAEMKMPGRGWLEFEVRPQSAERMLFTQTAYFAPHGLFGLLYWYALFIPHKFIFDGMADRIAARAQGEFRPVRAGYVAPVLAVALMVVALVTAVVLRLLDRD